MEETQHHETVRGCVRVRARPCAGLNYAPGRCCDVSPSRTSSTPLRQNHVINSRSIGWFGTTTHPYTWDWLWFGMETSKYNHREILGRFRENGCPASTRYGAPEATAVDGGNIWVRY